LSLNFVCFRIFLKTSSSLEGLHHLNLLGNSLLGVEPLPIFLFWVLVFSFGLLFLKFFLLLNFTSNFLLLCLLREGFSLVQAQEE